MNEETGQAPINEEEVKLIKSVFKDNENLLKTMRALFFGFSLSAEELELLRSTFSNTQLTKIIKKRFLPEISKDTPIGQLGDPWLNETRAIYGQNPTQIEQTLHYKKETIKMLKTALDLLENPRSGAISIEYNPNQHPNDPLGISLLIRNQFISHIETQLSFLRMIAEAEEKTKTDKVKDSTR